MDGPTSKTQFLCKTVVFPKGNKTFSGNLVDPRRAWTMMMKSEVSILIFLQDVKYA